MTKSTRRGLLKQEVPLVGLLLVCQNGKPLCVPLPFSMGTIELGRGTLSKHVDVKMSRHHARVRFDGRCFFVEDLGSHNGTHVDGVRLEEGRAFPNPRVLRVGDSLFVFSADLRPIQSAGIRRDGEFVHGPALQAVYERTRNMACFSDILHICGESGVGKEGVARAAHAAGAHSNGPFVAVNCATVAEGVAERLLFGARRGAYSGSVADAVGLLQAANGGTLFLDEIAELPLSVQAKLLRAVESHEVLPLGSNKPVPVNLHLYSATHKKLRAEVHHGRFREDLYFRIGRPDICLPPLRQRMEEIPWLVDLALRAVSREITPQLSLIELCLLRYWPGNVRELLAEIRIAGLTALAAKRNTVEHSDLSEDAGRRFSSSPHSPPFATSIPQPEAPRSSPPLAASVPVPPPTSTVPAHTSAPLPPAPPPTRELIEDTLRKEEGNISRAARALRLHRTQLKRWLQRFGLAGSSANEDLQD